MYNDLESNSKYKLHVKYRDTEQKMPDDGNISDSLGNTSLLAKPLTDRKVILLSFMRSTWKKLRVMFELNCQQIIEIPPSINKVLSCLI